MADVKISALPAASTPLAGTEVLPIVQGGTTDKVSVADLTAGRTVAASAVVVGAGTVSAPGFTFSGDTNTGIYSPAADTIAFTEGGVERMRIDANGNVGIGTSSPGARLDVAGNILVRGGPVSEGGEVTLYNPDTTTIGAIFDVSGADVTRWFTTRNNSLHQIGQLSGTGGVVSLYTAGTERMRITSDGEVYIAGTTDQGAFNLQVNGTGVWGAGAYTNGSDARIKDDIAPIASGLDVVAKLRPVQFRYKESWSKDRFLQPGFIAQELQEALADQPYAEGVVHQGPEYMSVSYQTLIPVLAKAVQELTAKLEAAEARIATLEAR